MHFAFLASFKISGVPARLMGESFDASLKRTVKMQAPAFADVSDSDMKIADQPGELGDVQSSTGDNEPLEVKIKLSNLNETFCNSGVSEMKSSFASGGFASQLGNLTGIKLGVGGLVASVVNDGPTDDRFDPFKQPNQHKSVQVSNQTDRTPGVTEINVEGTYDRATGQWHSAPQLGDTIGTMDLAADLPGTRETRPKPVQESTRTQDLEYVYGHDWRHEDRVDDQPASVAHDLDMMRLYG